MFKFKLAINSVHNFINFNFCKNFQYSSLNVGLNNSKRVNEPNWDIISSEINSKYIIKIEQLKKNIPIGSCIEKEFINFHNLVIKTGNVTKIIGDQNKNLVLCDRWIINEFTDLNHSWPYVFESMKIMENKFNTQELKEINEISERITYTIDKFNREIIGISENVCDIKMSESEFIGMNKY